MLECSVLTWPPAGEVPVTCLRWGILLARGVVRTLLATGTVLESTVMVLRIRSDIHCTDARVIHPLTLIFCSQLFFFARACDARAERESEAAAKDLSQPRPFAFQRVYPTRRVNILLSLRCRRTKDKIGGLWPDYAGVLEAQDSLHEQPK